MDILLRRGEANAADVRGELPDPPSYDAVRTTLRILTGKGHAVRRSDGVRFLYAPAVDLEAARADALGHLVDTFFEGSAARAAIALLHRSDLDLEENDVARLEARLRQAENRS